eukprot:CAMPEP_0177658130 /NCGR_PEP_ID=MMETSP0447-20121125/16629_1 /TAXON_ID=0 /ORGANISM="Stygamoeba regulata, Strain BSH-02190019" /LENGTH=52 /DNA_ID=CAMNT_0019162681 /DNA_START=767 /DNA_END=925 /DNA_ORIENTATION=+
MTQCLRQWQRGIRVQQHAGRIALGALIQVGARAGEDYMGCGLLACAAGGQHP